MSDIIDYIDNIVKPRETQFQKSISECYDKLKNRKISSSTSVECQIPQGVCFDTWNAELRRKDIRLKTWQKNSKYCYKDDDAAKIFFK